MKKLMPAVVLAALLSCDVLTSPEPLEEVNPKTPPTTQCPGYAIPDNCPPFPTGGPNVITGTVLERTATGTTPKMNARVWAWVQLKNGNGYSAGSVTADLSGNFRFPLLPDAEVILQAGGDGYNQPCANMVTVTSAGAHANVEVVSTQSPLFDPNPPAPSITGVVYETTPTGRHPVVGALVFAETLLEIVAATTTTDSLGRYSFCRLPYKYAWITPVLPDYEIKGTEVTLGGAVKLDLEMRRK